MAQEGVNFRDITFEEALKQAKSENKLVFMDCYTSWCGPCKNMADKVFPQKAAGDYFSPRFVCVKYDMEKGAGVELAKKFEGGYCFVFRLCVEDYHRYFYFDDGMKSENTFIRGRLHTVQPAALGSRRVFTENCREYTVIETAHFGLAVQCEVGAMMVGRIVNYKGAGEVKRGEEKGKFEFGGSTIIVLTQKGAVLPDEEFLKNTAEEKETKVKCGERIGVAARG